MNSLPRSYEGASLRRRWARLRPAALVFLVAAALIGVGCGSDDDNDKSSGDRAKTTSSGDGPNGKIKVVYDPPNDQTGELAKQFLQLGGTDGVAAGFTSSFKLPHNLKIHVVNGVVGPNYDPSKFTITLSYGFVDFTASVLKKNFPELRTNDEEFGKQLAAVDAFFLIHEFGHAFIHIFELPVLGKEEDAADAISTTFFTEEVKNGPEYAFDAARFFNALSARQRNLAAADYFDEHSLDKQRAYSIVCLIAGSSEKNFNDVARLKISAGSASSAARRSTSRRCRRPSRCSSRTSGDVARRSPVPATGWRNL